MTSVMVSSNRIDNVFPGRNMVNSKQQATWGYVDFQQQQQMRSRNTTCGARSRLMSLPIPSATDSLGLPSPIGAPAGLLEQQHHVFQGQGYETAPRRQPLTSSPQSMHSNSSDEALDVIAQALAQFNFPQQPGTEPLACQRPKAGLERSISMPAESALKQQQALLQQQQQQQQPVNASRYKTEMCRPFEEHGFCKYGDKCQFAHGIRELRTVNRHPKYKTELCRTFHTVGFCAYGSRCHFVHNEDERSAPMPPSRASPPLSIQSGAAAYPPHHLLLTRCGSLGSAADSPPASPVDVCPPTPTSLTSSFYGTPGTMTSPVSELTLEDISTFIASLRSDAAACYNSPPSPPDSIGYGGSEGCYDTMSSSSVESSPSKYPQPATFRGVQHPFSYYN